MNLLVAIVILNWNGKKFFETFLQSVVRYSKDINCKKISLTVNRNNLNSIKAYENAGFKNTGELIQDIGHGYVMDDYSMEKFL